jgi:glutamate/tyrosine decarboxylase-like PLP-dependent enzyme
MEKEAVADIARMFGWETHLGHLTGGGTMANLEALWVAGELAPARAIVASEQAHYTHARISGVLKLPFDTIACDERARMDPDALEDRLQRGGVGTVVATLGTTATGSVDPLPEILTLREKYGFRLHADCAYGGYFVLASNLAPSARAAFDRVTEVDSIVIDPHKHGLQPYGCGCVLFRDPSVGQFYQHDSPYTYFSSKDLHLGEISLECSRAGASAVALWATQKLLPLAKGDEFAGMLDACRSAALALHEKLAADRRWLAAFPPELDIVIWAARSEIGAASSTLAQQVFDAAARDGLHLALVELPARFLGREASPADPTRFVTCLRSVLMRPAQADRIDELYERLGRALARATR